MVKVRVRAAAAWLLAAGFLLACHPTAQDSSGRSASTPAADTPETPTEPAAAPVASGAPANPDFAGPLQAAGMTPLWGLSIRADGLTLTRPGHPVVEAPNPGPELHGPAAVWASPDGGFAATLKPGRCSDAAAGRDYPYSAVVVVGAETLKGCARPVR